MSPMAGAALYNGMGGMAGMNGLPPPLVSPADAGFLLSYEPYGLGAPMLEYPAALDQSIAGTSYVR